MGLLKIFSWRSGKAKSREDSLHPQQLTSLNTTRSAPVSASEAHITPFRYECERSEIFVDQPNEINSADSPLNPAIRTVLDDDRPGSSDTCSSENNDMPMVLQRPQREARRPPLSFRKKSSLSLTQMVSERQNSFQFGGPNSDAGSFTEHHHPGAPMSKVTRRQSRDLLDAAEEFRPLGFRNRIQAAGVRDYGEDVANRNMHVSATMSQPDSFRLFGLGSSLSEQSGLVKGRKSIDSINERYDSQIREMPSQADISHPERYSGRNKNRLSLNTSKPSGYASPSIQTPRSTVTRRGHREGLASSDVDSPDAEPDMWSRHDHASVTGSHYSTPGSSVAIRYTTDACDTQSEHIDKENDFAEEQEFGDMVSSNHSTQRRSAASGGQASVKAAASFSHGTLRSSLASSVTSRYPSMDFMPLGYPKLRGNPKTGSCIKSDDNDISMGRSQSLRSHRHSRSNSGGDLYSQQRTRSLLTRPFGLKSLVEIDRKTDKPRSISTRDGALGSPSSFSNAHYSGASGSVRPSSRHTKTTSIDSVPRPPSSQSYLSASLSQSASGWSPSTTRSTGFNIDDYVSSDDDSFTTRRRPSGKGEEDLLFKGGYGVTGAALPGLLESMIDACPPPLIELNASQLKSPSETSDEEEEVKDVGAADVPDIEDDRLSEDRDLPCTLLQHVQANVEHGHVRTFGRHSCKPKAHRNRGPMSSWLPNDEWADRVQTGRRVPPASTNRNKGIYEEMRPPCRGQKRLSALGTLHGRTPDFADSGEETAAKEFNSVRESVPSPIKEEADATVVARLRKDDKARKREFEAQNIRRKRMTTAFGAVAGYENVLADAPGAAYEEEEEEEEEEKWMEERGRTRVRRAK